MRDAAARRAAVVETDPSSSFACDYAAGVNRVLALPPYLLVDNIGRNVELWRFQPGASEPAARAIYDLTDHPGDPAASLLDVDIHAAFLSGDGRTLFAVNHYGRFRGFALPPAAGRLEPVWDCQLLGDTERIVLAGDCCIASSPRGEFTDDPPQPGIFVFEPITASRTRAGGNGRLRFEQALAEWGVISALTASPAADRLAVAAGPRLAVFDLRSGNIGRRLGECLWESNLAFDCQWLHFDETGRLWTGGPLLSPAATSGGGGSDWRGGQVQACNAGSGARLCAAALPDAAGWGYGADPIVPAAGCRELYVLGHEASLHVVDTASGASRRIYEPSPSADDSASLGIGHAALLDGRIYAGFSRGGFRLWRYDVGPA